MGTQAIGVPPEATSPPPSVREPEVLPAAGAGATAGETEGEAGEAEAAAAEEGDTPPAAEPNPEAVVGAAAAGAQPEIV